MLRNLFKYTLRVACIVYLFTSSWLILQAAATTIHDSWSAALESFFGKTVATRVAVAFPTIGISTCAALESFSGRAVTTHAVASRPTTGVSTHAAMADLF